MILKAEVGENVLVVDLAVASLLMTDLHETAGCVEVQKPVLVRCLVQAKELLLHKDADLQLGNDFK